MVRRRHTHTRQSVGHRHTHTNWRFYTPLGGRMPSPWGLTAVAFSLCKISLILPREVGGWASKEKDTPLRWSYSGRSNKGPPGVCAAQNYTTGRLGANLIYIQLKKLIDKKTVPVHVRRLSLFLERRGRIWVIHEVFFFFLSKCPKSFSLILTHTDTRNYSAHCGLVLFLSSLFSFFWWVCVCLSHRLLTFFILSLSLSLYNWIDSIFSLFFLFGLYALLRLVSVCVLLHVLLWEYRRYWS